MPHVVYDPNGPVGIFGSIVHVITNDQAVMDAISDYHPFHAPEGVEPTQPYLVYNVITTTPAWSTGPGYYEASRIQLDIYATDPDLVISIGESVMVAFDSARFPIYQGDIAKFHRVNNFITEDPDKRSQDATRVFRHCIEYDVTISKTKG